MSSITTYPENGITYDADDAAGWLTTRNSGLYSVTEDFTVTPGSKTTVQISAGQAWVHPSRWIGRSIIMKQADSLTLPDSNANLPRIDRVVLRYDALARETTLAVLTGTPASSPAAPALTRTSQTYELCLAEIARPAGSTAITAANITDTRSDASLCGLMQEGMASVDAYSKAEANDLFYSKSAANANFYSRSDANAAFYSRSEADARFSVTYSKVISALGFVPSSTKLPYSIVYDHSYTGTGDVGDSVKPVNIPLNGDYDAITVIRTKTATYPKGKEITRQRVLMELLTQEAAADTFKSNYITLKGLTSSFTAANRVNDGLIVIQGNWNEQYTYLRHTNRTLSMYYTNANWPARVLNDSDYQYHVFGITLDSSILPAT